MMHTILANNKLMTVADNVNDTFKYFVVYPMVPKPTNMKYYRATEHILDRSMFSDIDKVYFLKHASDMIFVEVVKSTKNIEEDQRIFK